MTNQQLFKLCRKYGAAALMWRRKFAGLLPEVFKRKLYVEKGYESIFEFAAKLAGMSRDQVAIVLNLERRFEQLPKLKTLLQTGEVSVNKLARVISVVTPANEELWAQRVQMFSKSTLETFIKDEKILDTDGLNKAENDQKSLPGQAEFDLDSDVREELNELQKKGIDVSAIIREALVARREKIAQQKEEVAQEQRVAAPSSRYIPIKVKQILRAEHGTKCSLPYCGRPAEEIHHTQRFSLSQNHDPRYLAPLCKNHHVIAHSIDQKFQEARAHITDA